MVKQKYNCRSFQVLDFLLILVQKYDAGIKPASLIMYEMLPVRDTPSSVPSTRKSPKARLCVPSVRAACGGAAINRVFAVLNGAWVGSGWQV